VLSRWQRIQLVRDLSTAAAGEEEGGELSVIGSRYARVSKPGSEEQNKARRIQAGQIFERQVFLPTPHLFGPPLVGGDRQKSSEEVGEPGIPREWGGIADLRAPGLPTYSSSLWASSPWGVSSKVE